MEEKLKVHLKNLVIALIISGLIGLMGLLTPEQILKMALPGIFIVLSLISMILRQVNMQRNRLSDSKPRKFGNRRKSKKN